MNLRRETEAANMVAPAVLATMMALMALLLAAFMAGCAPVSSGTKERQQAPLDCITYDVPKSMTWVDEIRMVSDPRTNQRWWVLEDRYDNTCVVLPVEPTGDVG